MINLKKINKVLFIFSHPDDETLGAGGTINRFIRERKKVFLAFSNNGISSRFEKHNGKNSSQLFLQSKQIKEDLGKVIKLYKIKEKNSYFGNFPDNKSDTVALLDIIKWCEKVIKKTKPDLIVTHHRYCSNIDHQKLHEAIMISTRPNTTQKINVISSEILSSTGYLKPSKFEPNLFIELSKKDIDAKIKAMNLYSTERKKFPHPRSKEVIKALSILRGSYSGNNYAEAFIINNFFY